MMTVSISKLQVVVVFLLLTFFVTLTVLDVSLSRGSFRARLNLTPIRQALILLKDIRVFHSRDAFAV